MLVNFRAAIGWRPSFSNHYCQVKSFATSGFSNSFVQYPSQVEPPGAIHDVDVRSERYGRTRLFFFSFLEVEGGGGGVWGREPSQRSFWI